MPAVTTKFDTTKHDIRNGRKTGSPVSDPPLAYAISLYANLTYRDVELNQQSFWHPKALRSFLQSFLAYIVQPELLHVPALLY